MNNKETKGFFCFLFDKPSFLCTLFFENKAQINKNNFWKLLFMLKQVCLAKMSLILQKMKIGPKSYIIPFCRKALNCNCHNFMRIIFTLVQGSPLCYFKIIQAVMKYKERDITCTMYIKCTWCFNLQGNVMVCWNVNLDITKAHIHVPTLIVSSSLLKRREGDQISYPTEILSWPGF